MAKASKMAAKAMGKAKGAAKALSGYPGIFHHIAGEHGEVSAMMKRVAGSSEGSKVREELFPEIRKNLLAHTQAEEKEFYGPLRRFPETKEFIAQAMDEHRKVQEYLEKLESGNKATKTWLQTFERMMRAVERHVEMEEHEMFPAANEVLSGEQAREMEDRFQEVEEQVKARF